MPILSLLTAMVLAAGSFQPGPATVGEEAPRTMNHSEEQEAQMDSIRGRTIRWTWTEGPTAGVTHEHVFRRDGTVT